MIETDLEKTNNLEEIEKILEYREESGEFDGEMLDVTRAYLYSIARYPMLNNEENNSLLREYQINHDPRIKNKIVEANLRLVVYVVSKHGYFNTSHEFIDLIQEGNIGLMNAVDKFDFNRKGKFSTCAYYWIRAQVLDAMNNRGNGIKIPVHLRRYKRKYQLYVDSYQKKHGHMPSEEEIKNKLDLTDKMYKNLMHFITNVDNIKSLNEEYDNNSDKEITFMDMVVDKKKDGTTSFLDRTSDLGLLKNLKSGLDGAEYYILYYYSLIENGYNLDELGEFLTITREAVRRNKERALSKAKFIIDKNRELIDSAPLEELLPENFHEIAILAYMKAQLTELEYFIFYHIWSVKGDIESLFAPSSAKVALEIYEDIFNKYERILTDESAFKEVVKSVAGDRFIKKIFKINVDPIEAQIGYKLLEEKAKVKKLTA